MYADVTYRTASELNSAMVRVYNHMALATATSFIVSLLVSSSTVLMGFFFTGFMKWITIFAPLVAAFGISIYLNTNPSKWVSVGLLHAFAAIMGISFSTIFVTFKLGSITSAFIGAALLFVVLSFYGYFTKKDLTKFGQFMFVGLIAIIIAGVINIFIGNSVAQMVISALAIIVFSGLTAWDTQRLREELAFKLDNNAEVQGALSLYMNFINIFLNLLQLIDDRN